MLMWKLAFRNIFRQRRRSVLTALSMSGGYILCVLSFSMTEGSYNNVIKIFTEDHTGHIQIHSDDYLTRPKIHKNISIDSNLEKVLQNSTFVRNYTKRIFSPALAYSEHKNTQVRVVGIDPELERNTSRLADKVKDGAYFNNQPDSDGYYSAMIGLGAAKSLGLSIGDELILISQGADGSIANDIFLVGAIVGSKSSWDSAIVYLPLVAASEFLTLYGKTHQYSIMLHDFGDVIEATESLKKALPQYSINPWMEVEETFYKTMQSDKEGNRFSMFIIVFIVFIGVLNTVLMSVLERTHEFGVLKAIGSRPQTITFLILLETSLLAFLSVVLGIILAIPLILWFANVGITMPEPVDVGGIAFQHMTGEFSLRVFLLPMLFILSFAIVVAIFPGIRAARVLPTEAMRGN
jgi:putative ABC transport system permease protein